MKNYRTLFQGLVESRVFNPDAIREAAGEDQKLTHSEAQKVWDQGGEEIYNALKQDPESYKQYMSKVGVDVIKALNAIGDTKAESVIGRGTVRSETLTTGDVITHDGRSMPRTWWERQAAANSAVAQEALEVNPKGRAPAQQVSVENRTGSVRPLPNGPLTARDINTFFAQNPNASQRDPQLHTPARKHMEARGLIRGNQVFANKFNSMSAANALAAKLNQLHRGSGLAETVVVGIPVDNRTGTPINNVQKGYDRQAEIQKLKLSGMSYAEAKAQVLGQEGYAAGSANEQVNVQQVKAELIGDIRNLSDISKQYPEFMNMMDGYLNGGNLISLDAGIVGGLFTLFGVKANPTRFSSTLKFNQGGRANIDAQFIKMLGQNGHNNPKRIGQVKNLATIALFAAMGGVYLGDALVSKSATEIGIGGGEMKEFIDWVKAGGKGEFRATGKYNENHLMTKTVQEAARISNHITNAEKMQIMGEVKESMVSYMTGRQYRDLVNVTNSALNTTGKILKWVGLGGAHVQRNRRLIAKLNGAKSMAEQGRVEEAFYAFENVENVLSQINQASIRATGRSRMEVIDCIDNLSDVKGRWRNDINKALNGGFNVERRIYVLDESTLDQTILADCKRTAAERGGDWKTYWNECAVARKGEGYNNASTDQYNSQYNDYAPGTPEYNACLNGVGLCKINIKIVVPKEVFTGGTRVKSTTRTTGGTGPGPVITPPGSPGFVPPVS